ncbi:hypothetical protein [Pseudoxanthomonas suwonensis]|uniref:hypothetical protein n=1 Tax=Pseudoxanthomonas suwonensis TaxID=314722 RepID=UPI0004630138|nr:hypothetical protein [Pseudoxanthomonas suwonensis]
MKELIREELAMVGGGEGSEQRSVVSDVAYALGYIAGMLGRMNQKIDESGNELLGAMQYGA